MSTLDAIRKVLAESSKVTLIWRLRVDPKPFREEWDQHFIFFLIRRRSEDLPVDMVLAQLEASIGIKPAARFPFLVRIGYAGLQYAETIGTRCHRPEEITFLQIDDGLPEKQPQTSVAVETTVLRKINLRLFVSYDEANAAFECAKAFYAGD